MAAIDKVMYGGVRSASTAAVLSKASTKASADKENPTTAKKRKAEEVEKLKREAGQSIFYNMHENTV